MFLYLNTPAMAAPAMQQEMPDCHMAMDDAPPADAPAENPSKSCCNVVGCCPLLAPLAFVPLLQRAPQPLKLDAAVQPARYLQLTRLLERPPRA